MSLPDHVLHIYFMQKIPKWWIWFYWICPTSWSLNALLSSQYGDMNKEILIFGEQKTAASFLQDYCGFHHDRLFLVANVLIAFPIVFASIFAYSVRKLNFQRQKWWILSLKMFVFVYVPLFLILAIHVLNKAILAVQYLSKLSHLRLESW